MAEFPKKSLFSFLQNARTRVFLTIALIVIGVGVVWFLIHWHDLAMLNRGAATVSGAPSVASVPGAGRPSADYVKAQTNVNITDAQNAQKAGKSFVPTIVRPGFVGNPDDFSGAASNQSRCPIHVMYKPNPANCTLDNLQKARESGVTAEELTCQGCACPVLKAAGYTVGDLKTIGLSAEQLRSCGFTLQDLVTAGFNPTELKTAGFSASELKNAGFTAAQLKDAGFSAATLKNAGFSAAELKSAGFSNADLRSAGFTAAQFAAADLSAAKGTHTQCDIAKLKQQRAAGISAAQLKNADCGAAVLKAAGFSALQLKDAGFSAAQLKDGGFSAGDLKDAGFSARDLKNAGFSAAALKDAGFSASTLKNAGFSAGQLVSAGFSPAELKAAGFTATDLRAAGVSAEALREAGFSAADLKAAGFSKGDLLRAGFSPQAAGYVSAPAVAENTAVASASTPAAATPTLGAIPSLEGSTREGRLAAFEKKEQAEMNTQQRANQIQRMQAMMQQQARTLMTGWGDVNRQEMQKAPENKEPAGAAGAAGGKGAAAIADESQGPILKAGTVLFAVLDSSINSDIKSPVMARIVAGQLNGSRLMGNFTRQHDELVLQFNLLSDPSYPKSLAINAVAIDADTARTALSGRVDHHYLLRYGTLFASSFLQGVSQGIINQGVSSDCLFGGFGCTLKPTPLNTNQQIAVGLGQVGQAYAQHMGESFNRPPTVRIAGGTGIGILLMGDLDLPANALPKHERQQDEFAGE